MSPTDWRYQDVLRLSVDQWITALRDPNVFDSNAISMIQFVYRQRNHESTASAIATSYSSLNQNLHYSAICAWNRKVAKALYNQYKIEPPIDKDGEKRYWNVVFDGEPKTPLDLHNHFYWKLRPNLILAMEAIHII